MADFRRWFTVLAVLAVMACAASAQVGVATGSANSLLACTAAAAGTPELRPEGFTELTGDIVISCTGGPDLQIGAAIPTTNIVVYEEPGVPVTSRYLSSNGASEALLIIDEAGSNITTGATGGFGPMAPQLGCTTAQQQATGGSSCNVIVGKDTSGTYEVAVPGPGNAGPTAQNVYQGKIGDFGSNTVTFYNVPVLPPATTGVTRTFRITNIRVPVPSYLATNGQVNVLISTSPNQVLPVTYQNILVGIVGPAMNASVSTVNNPFQQCTPTSRVQTATLIFTEGFATGFKTRVVPGGAANGIPGNASGNVPYAAEALNLGPTGNNQNIPGGLYGGFAANSESGFIFPQFSSTTSSITSTAGLADYGSRLKAVFSNIPAGLTMYVSVTSAGPAPTVIGGTSVLPYAVLVATNSGEATPDGSSFAPIAATLTGSDNLGTLGVIALSANSSGVATAVWEVTNSNPSATDVLQFGVYISYSATSATSANPYGLPITVLPLGAPANNVALSYAPEPGGGTFAASTLQGTGLPIPRFAIVKTQQGPWTTIQLCQTTLLYPFVTGASGFDTGIAVANTSWDPFGTVNQTGSCKLYGYGVTVASAGNTPLQTTVSGCDQISNPLPGTNCFPIVPAGQVQSVLASATLTNFQGYVIAVCNFQYAHGYAAVTDLGIRNLWSSYLALELNSASIGSPRKGTAGIETLAH